MQKKHHGPSASKMAIMATIKVTFTTEPLILLEMCPKLDYFQSQHAAE